MDEVRPLEVPQTVLYGNEPHMPVTFFDNAHKGKCNRLVLHFKGQL